MRRLSPLVIVMLVAGCRPPAPPSTTPPDTPPPAGGLALPGGFESTVFHDGVGRARHLAVTSDGIVYVKLRGQVQLSLIHI